MAQPLHPYIHPFILDIHSTHLKTIQINQTQTTSSFALLGYPILVSFG